MKREKMAGLLQVMEILLYAGLGFILFGALPQLGKQVALAAPEYAWAYWPCLIWALASAAPVFAAALPVWRIFASIREKGKAFSHENARRFRQIAGCAWVAAGLFVTGEIVLAFLGAGAPVLVCVVTPAVVGLCGVFGFACYAVSCLVQEAAGMREENELTI